MAIQPLRRLKRCLDARLYQRAVDLSLSSSGLANVIHELAALFDLTHQGRAFIILHDPLERATSMYWHRTSSHCNYVLRNMHRATVSRIIGCVASWKIVCVILIYLDHLFHFRMEIESFLPVPFLALFQSMQHEFSR